MDLGQVNNLQEVPSERAELYADCHKEDVLTVNEDAFMPAKHGELRDWKHWNKQINIEELQKDPHASQSL